MNTLITAVNAALRAWDLGWGISFLVDSDCELMEALRQAVADSKDMVLVPIEDCSMCNNDGIYFTTEGYPINCFCRDKTTSRYNQNKAMLSAVEVKP